jgi:glutathione synthase/RimK-type ligase-like ATP-grasp enzyme
MVIKIHPYKIGSESAKLLSEHMSRLVGRKIWRVKEDFKVKPKHRIINWGNSHTPLVCHINPVNRVLTASNKLHTFQRFKEYGVPTVEWTTVNDVARQWIYEDNVVYSRYSLNGHSGQGIRLYKGKADYDAFINHQKPPLYTKYFPAKGEYRVHVVNGQVIDFARKKKKEGAEGNKFIRAHDNGYVFARVDVQLPQVVADSAIKAVASLGLHFGAVDVLHNEKANTAAVLEVNTAPGLDNHTASCYAQALLRIAR